MTESSAAVFSYPHGKYRTKLATYGLIGKLNVSSDMNDDDVAAEIRSIFKGPMNNDPNFQFLYLQPTGCGSKSLAIPSQSSTFTWIKQKFGLLQGVKSNYPDLLIYFCIIASVGSFEILSSD